MNLPFTCSLVGNQGFLKIISFRNSNKWAQEVQNVFPKEREIEVIILRFSAKVQDPDSPLDVHTTYDTDLDLPIALRKGCDLVLNIIQLRTLYYVIIHRLNIMHLYQDCLPNICLHKWNWEEALKN